MQAYIYDELTKEFLFEDIVEESPLEKDVILMPPNATLIPVNKKLDGYAQVFNGEAWEYVEDHRNKTVWKSYDESMTIEELGAIPDGWSLERPEQTAEMRQEQFNKDFFQTSLGYVRRKVSMATGEIKDFLSDLLPTISMGVQMGQPVQIIAYDKPDFTQEITDWTVLQNVQTVTAQFVQECFLQLSNDFKPVEVQNENTTDYNQSDVQNELDTKASGTDSYRL